MVGDLISNTLSEDDGKLHLSEEMNETITQLRSFLYDNVYRNYRVHNEFVKAQRIIRDLYAYFLEHELPGRGLSTGCIELPAPDNEGEMASRHRRVCDFIAGMTDRYAISLYTQLFMPKPWSVL